MKFVYLVLVVLVFAKDEPELLITNFEGGIQDLLWCGTDSSIMILRNENDKVYRGSNKGTIYKKILQDSNEVKKIIKSQANLNLVYFLGTKGELWFSANCGDSVKQLKVDFTIDKFKPHPSMSSWILASTSSNQLYLSQNSGLNWQKIGEDITEAEWPFNLEQIKAGIVESTIYALTTSNKLIKTIDFFKTTTKIEENVQTFTLTEAYFFIMKEKELMVGNVYELFGNWYTFEWGDKTYMKVLDATKSRAFILVAKDHNAVFGDVYVSNSYATHFELSIANCLHTSIHGADFIKIEGLEGTYITNTLNERAAVEYAKLEPEQLEGAMEVRKNKIATQLIQNNIKTFFTFDYGKSWKYINPPNKDFNECHGDDICSLHLFVNRFTSAPLISLKNSPGTIIANGNVGRNLNTNSMDRKVYLSRNGGFSWEEIATKPHNYAITDSGSIIVLAKLKSSTIRYSLDGGKIWIKEIMTRENTTVSSIVTEPSGNAQYVLVRSEFFNTAIEEVTKHSIHSINFGNLYDRNCKKDIELADADYEVWNPPYSNKCLMGRKVSYIRKKPEAMCYNGMETVTKNENCECTANDYECEFGFIRVNGSCIFGSNNTEELCNLVKSRRIISGYRKIAGDTCKGGISYEPINCGNFVVSGVSTWTIILIGMTGMIVLAICCTCLKSLDEKAEFGKVKYKRARWQGEEEIAMKEYDI